MPVRAHRLTASSKYPISKLSPASQTVRRTNVRQERKQINKKLKKLDKFDCNISDKQHTEVLQLVSSTKDSKAVHELIAEGDHIVRMRMARVRGSDDDTNDSNAI